MKSVSSTRCKQCGKVIVGSSKMGLCDRCFDKDATTTAGIAGGGFALYKIIKAIVKAIKHE